MVRERLKALKERVTGDNLGPDRGTRDQLEARKERARIEAQREREREQRRERIEQAREAGRREVEQSDSLLGRVAEGIEQATAEFEDAGGDLEQIDLDGDGTGLGTELSDEPDAGLRAQVDDNTADIDELQEQFDGDVFDADSGGGGFASEDPFGDAESPFASDQDSNGGLF